MKMEMKQVPLKNVQIEDAFWDQYIGLVRSVILPHMWNLINDNVPGAEKSWCIYNFRVAAGLESGPHKGQVFQDTDVAKWIEAVAYTIAKEPDADLEKEADSAIDLIAAAQCNDGYLDTYFQIEKLPRWENLFEGHELYTAGHMIEAAVAYYQATGKDKFLQCVIRLADLLVRVFGPEGEKRHGYPGHPEVELALVRLYRLTKKKEYLELARHFIRIRGEKPNYFSTEKGWKEGHFLFPEFKEFEFDYCQADRPLSEQTKAEGHAVRAGYLYSAMADIATEYNDDTLLSQCKALWEDIARRQMYVTGSIGSAAFGERFTTDYDLPNNTNYSESCASVALLMFSDRMFLATGDGKYMDVCEQALYNTILAGIALDGKHFFYVNPLEMVPEVVKHNPTMRHVKTTRQPWFGVACCPPNITRTLASLGRYMINVKENTLFVNLYLAGNIETAIQDGTIGLEIHANYPAEGRISIEIKEAPATESTLALRIPAFSSTSWKLSVNGQEVKEIPQKGYLYLKREWKPSDTIVLQLDTSFRYVYCNPKVRDNLGKVCLMRGPEVYCFEECDNSTYLNSYALDTSIKPKEVFREDILGGTVTAKVTAIKSENWEEDELYAIRRPSIERAELTAIPYSQWNNRGEGEMQVWMREKYTGE
jgi:DUF1680 family protein